MPGVHLPVTGWDNCVFEKFDSCLILSWNYSDHLLKRLIKTKFKGDVFVPFPAFKKVN